MQGTAKRLMLGLALLSLSAGSAQADSQTILGQKFFLRSPSADPNQRQVSGKAKEGPGSPNTVVGNPATAGASLRVIANGGTDSDQTFTLPASGWSPISTLGYRYSSSGAVKKVLIKRTSSGVFLIKISLKGSGGPLNVVPPNPGDSGGFILDLTGGDSYCVAFGGVAGGSESADNAQIWFIRNPNAEACPSATSATTTTTLGSSTTTSTTSASTTSTTLIAGCDCCAFTKLSFTTGLPDIGGGGCGTVKDAANNVLISLDCGGLYTGGGGATLPLPSVVPDMGSSITKVQNCAAGVFDIAATTDADTGSHRTCTSAGVADPDYPACVGGANAGKPCVSNSDCSPGTCTGTMPGCLFGPPLPIPNSSFTGSSVCVVNRVSTSASGSGTCGGASNITLPLSSDLYLEGDLLDGSTANRPDVPGIQPCPLCQPSPPPGGSCSAANCCWGGSRHDMPCTPGDSASLGAAYPTSHDCPPPPGPLGAQYVGALPVPFALTTDDTGTDPKAHKVADNTQNSGQERFCGFCANSSGTVFKNPPLACPDNAFCAANGGTGCPSAGTACNSCRQRTGGAFGTASTSPGSEHEITEIGSPAGVCLDDGLPHDATLVSVFCIPPSFNPTVDANGDLPGPGAVALSGVTQLLEPVAVSTTTSTTTPTATSTSTTTPTATTTSTTTLGPCGSAAFPVCLGDCPSGSLCGPNLATMVCQCMTP